MGSICTTDKPATLSWESYTKEQAMGRPETIYPKSEKALSSITSLEKMPENSDDVVRDLEQRQNIVIKEVLQSNAPLTQSANTLVDFMKNGSEEFKERTGRNMTYSEIRAAWG
jgi:hypothetical protein